MQDRTFVYSAPGSTLNVFELDTTSGALALRQQIEQPAAVEYAWPDAARTHFYIATSHKPNPGHFVQAWRILPSGELQPLATPVPLAHRPLHLSLDAQEAHLLVAYNDPPHVTVHRIEADGTIGKPVPQPPLDFGITVHQVRATPAGNRVLVPAVGHHPTGLHPGSLTVFAYDKGRLSPHARLNPDPARAAAWQGVKFGAQGFSPRHVDFHPTERWMYLGVEAQGELRLYDWDEEGISPQPRAICSTLAGTPPLPSAQMAGAVHVHPNGRHVYVSNRAYDEERVGDRDVFKGGYNDIAVFDIDPHTGVPTLVQRIDTQGIFPRTFGLDAKGRMLVAGNQDFIWRRAGDGFERVVPGLAVFRVGGDGRLEFLHKLDYADDGRVNFWTGVVTL